jgi:outer membrane protein
MPGGILAGFVKNSGRPRSASVRVFALGALLTAGAFGTATCALAENLDSALASAYRYNPQIDAERARLRATDENVARAMSGYRPTINSEMTAGVQNSNTDPSSAADGTSGPRTFSITLAQPLFRGFRTVNAVSEAEASVRAGQQTLRIVEQDVLQAAATAYVDVVRDLAELRLRQSNLEFLSRELKATQDRFSVGEVTRTDVAQARARRAAAVSAISTAQANLKSSRARYRRIIGREPGRLFEPPVPNRKIPRSLERALSIGLQENPLIVRSLYNEQAARFAVDTIIGELLPSAQLEAQYQLRKDPNPITQRSETGTLLGRLSIPLYQGGETRARVRQAKHTHVSRLQEIEQQKTIVREQIITAWTAFQAAKNQLVSDRSQVEANQIALQGVQEEERVGQRTLLDVLDAQQELLDSRVNLSRTRRNIIVNAYTLLSAIGRLDGTSYGVSNVVYDPDQHYHDVRAEWFKISITDKHGHKEDLDLAKQATKDWVRDNVNRGIEQKKAVYNKLGETIKEKVYGPWHSETVVAPYK